MRWRTVVGFVLLLSFSFLVHATAPPDPDGPGAFDVIEWRSSLTDPSTGRSMDLLVLLPDAVPDGAPPAMSPLILFHHGFLLSADLYRSYGERLASHGFVVAMPTFPMSFLSVDHAKLAVDVRFVLDTCLSLNLDPESELYGKIDPTRIGSSGHSLGGKLSLLEAATDPRILAIAVLDPVDTGNPIFENPRKFPSVAPELMPEISAPLLIVGAELGKVLVTFSPCAPEDDNYQQFFEAANPPAVEITQLDVGHGQYVDPGGGAAAMACAIGSVSDEWVRSSSASYLTAFFRGHLMGDTSALTWLESRWASEVDAGQILIRRKGDIWVVP